MVDGEDEIEAPDDSSGCGGTISIDWGGDTVARSLFYGRARETVDDDESVSKNREITFKVIDLAECLSCFAHEERLSQAEGWFEFAEARR